MTRRVGALRVVTSVPEPSVVPAPIDLEALPARDRKALARLVVDLDELQAMARPGRRTWVTAEEWGRVHSGEVRLDHVRRQRHRARDLLERLGGPALTWSPHEDALGSDVIHAATPELVRFVAELVGAARAVLYPSEAPVEADPVQAPALEPGDLIDAKALAQAYRKESSPPLEVNLVARLFGIGVERARRVLGPVYRWHGSSPKVEERVGPESVDEARRLVLERAPMRRVARALQASEWGARSFAKRVWDATRQAAKDAIK